MKDLIIIGLLIAILLAVTNPAIEDHQQCIVDSVRNSVTDATMEPAGPLDQLWSSLAGEAAAGLTLIVDDALFTYKDYVLFSTMTTPDGGIISVGILGQVITGE